VNAAGVVFIILAVVAVVGLVAWLVVRDRREKARIAAMSPEERELHEATKAHVVAVKSAEGALKSTQKTCDREYSQAEGALRGAEKIGTRALSSYGTVRLFEDRVQTQDGTAYFSQGNVDATVDTAGNLAVTKRATFTRMAAGGLLLGPIGAVAAGMGAPKKKMHDTRELYLMVETPTFGSVVQCQPDDGPKVRQFAMAISNACRSFPSLEQQRTNAIAEASARLADAQSRSAHAVQQAQLALQAATGDVGRISAAKAALGAAAPQLALPAGPAPTHWTSSPETLKGEVVD
jgi:hypothetical protein